MKVLCPFCFKEVNVDTKTCTNADCPSITKDIPLPAEVFTHELFPIIVVGGRDAGKSVFLASLAWRMRFPIWGPFWEVKVIDYANATIDKNNFTNIVGKMFHPPYALPEGTDKNSVPLPLLISITFKGYNFRQHLCGFSGIKQKSLLVCFTDPAGEHFRLAADNAMELKRKYPVLHGNAKAAIALMDPIEVNDEWQELLWQYRGDDHRADRGKVSESLAALSLMPLGERNKLPVAVCLDKLDELIGEGSPLQPKQIFPEEGCFRIGSYGDTFNKTPGKISLPDLDAIDTTIRRVLYENACNHIFNSMGIPTAISKNEKFEPRYEELGARKTLLKAAFKYHAFFGVSALGQGKTKEIYYEGRRKRVLSAEPEPFRVLDPLLWIFWQYGFLSSTDERTR